MQASHIIHTVGPARVDGKHGEFDILSDCYENSLAKAVEFQCNSIAFPLIATGVYGFPKDRALQIAVSAISRFLLSHDMQVILVVFDRHSFERSDLKTANFNVHTEYENVKDRNGNYNRIFNGYVVDHSLKLEFDFKMQRLSQALSAIAGCMSNPDLSIRFTVKDASAVGQIPRYLTLAAVAKYPCQHGYLARCSRE